MLRDTSDSSLSYYSTSMVFGRGSSSDDEDEHNQSSNMSFYSTITRSPQHKQQRNHLPTVRFDPIIQYYASEFLSEDEIENYWWTRKELCEIQSNVVKTLNRMDNMEHHQMIDDEDFCPRGLECRTRRGIQTRVKNKAAVLRAISREYFMHRHYGESAAGVRVSCWQIIHQDEEAARMRGLIDEEEALSIFLEDAEDMNAAGLLVGTEGCAGDDDEDFLPYNDEEAEVRSVQSAPGTVSSSDEEDFLDSMMSPPTRTIYYRRATLI